MGSWILGQHGSVRVTKEAVDACVGVSAVCEVEVECPTHFCLYWFAVGQEGGSEKLNGGGFIGVTGIDIVCDPM